ncbi:Protein of unknown function [Gryllus bimaculatus]|nr:Protein of unknown function [Gryllus bimaculatus]
MFMFPARYPPNPQFLHHYIHQMLPQSSSVLNVMKNTKKTFKDHEPVAATWI